MITCTFEDGGKAFLRHITADVLLLRDNKILLVKRSMKLSEGGKWGLTGGYMERDETLAEGATREVYEESGWTLRGLTLLTINDNPNRPKEDRQNISMIYFAQAVEQTGEPDWESDEIRWFPLDKLPARDQIAFDHADSIDLYKKYLAENLSLPIIS
ncbi:MAG TPA: NUDIX hydrolase [Candidatus Saccharimonadales bacterium]|jgi:8-oxo-dGTP diphosphatase|nr:NUDIX hydrolase [Candidatus Saccharimonadales bacterium]